MSIVIIDGFFKRWDQVIALQVTSNSQVFALKSCVKSQVKTDKSWVKSQVLHFDFWVLSSHFKNKVIIY